MKLVLIKIGGCLITHKNSEMPKINEELMDQIAGELSEAYKELKDVSLIIIHGAGSFGHPIVKRTGIHKGIKNHEQLLGFAETQRLQNELNSIFCNLLIKKGMPAIPVQASASSIMENKRLKSMDIDVIKGLLEVGMVPVLYGVPSYDLENKCSILSGDQIMTYLASRLNAKKLIFATDVEGVYSADPKKDKNAVLIERISKDNIDKLLLEGSNHTDVTGGMYGKIMEILNLKLKAQIINGAVPGNIIKALKDEKVGTIVDLK